ncbi:Glycerate dehydrogenase [Posidoniimonas polymericola]|uniref:Glycerate dehydrogenase n=1 Tax=Posidoniimonas polymericola TaxID=2528002 RepID=A0A5C5XVL8_9BACT|nr:D-2-hydroxyacid dehydrogenase [Posidoniimonas polymericola]TWT66944.1 Glycerate dehydrogenase [Posidoniimonas polymericola]
MGDKTPQIVVVDGRALNPGDLDWTPFEELGQVEVFNETDRGQVAARLHGATAVISNKVVLDRDIIDSAPDLEYIGVTATGYDVIDTAAARERGIAVTNVPDYGADSVAQLTFALLLELMHRVGHHDAAVKQGRWSSQSSFCFWDYPQVELAGRTLGIVGMGSIGRRVAQIGQAFGMKVIASSRSPECDPALQIRRVSVDEVFAAADVVSLHCPLTAETSNLVNSERLRKMKPSAVLINTARGGLVVSEDLDWALREGVIGGAALDVLDQEPPPADHRLFSRENCVITPHLAWATVEARRRLMATAAENLRSFLAGERRNRVE